MKWFAFAATLLAALAGCSKSRPAAATAPAPAPIAQTPAPAPAAATLSGKVLETIDAGDYTYLKLRAASGDAWAAVPKTNLAVGSSATIAPQMTLDKFQSKTLHRTFDHIIFAVMAESAPAAPVPAEADHGALRVADIWASPAVLKDKPVVVRGKVVKFLPAIMGKNWIHLRDGSGSRTNGDDDITVTTSDRAAVGDVVTVSGTLHTDKDFGSGYRYPVIVEEAKVSK
jgi:hypothetical protein